MIEGFSTFFSIQPDYSLKNANFLFIISLLGHRCIWFQEAMRLVDLVDNFKVFSKEECVEKCFQKMTESKHIYGVTTWKIHSLYCYCNYKPTWTTPHNKDVYKSCHFDRSILVGGA